MWSSGALDVEHGEDWYRVNVYGMLWDAAFLDERGYVSIRYYKRLRRAIESKVLIGQKTSLFFRSAERRIPPGLISCTGMQKVVAISCLGRKKKIEMVSMMTSRNPIF